MGVGTSASQSRPCPKQDYGVEWEEAWAEHVANWEPLPDAANYVHSSKWDEEFFRTEEELETDPYPDNLAGHVH